MVLASPTDMCRAGQIYASIHMLHTHTHTHTRTHAHTHTHTWVGHNHTMLGIRCTYGIFSREITRGGYLGKSQNMLLFA